MYVIEINLSAIEGVIPVIKWTVSTIYAQHIHTVLAVLQCLIHITVLGPALCSIESCGPTLARAGHESALPSIEAFAEVGICQKVGNLHARLYAILNGLLELVLYKLGLCLDLFSGELCIIQNVESATIGISLAGLLITLQIILEQITVFTLEVLVLFQICYGARYLGTISSICSGTGLQSGTQVAKGLHRNGQLLEILVVGILIHQVQLFGIGSDVTCICIQVLVLQVSSAFLNDVSV